VENANALPPLSTGQKFRIATASVFDWGTYPFNGTLSAIAQARNDPKEWGQGWDAYGKRFGANFADNSIGTYMTVATCLRRVGYKGILAGYSPQSVPQKHALIRDLAPGRAIKLL
jgi:hypothetical protein